MLLAMPAAAAERTVLGEEFTDIWCGACASAGPALDLLLDVYADSFAFVQYHHGDEYALPWGDQRWSYYGCQYTPTAIFDGIDRTVGSVPDFNQQYTIYRTNHFLPARAMRTDVTITVGGEYLGGQTYRIWASVAIEPGGTAKTMRVYMVQVLDHWPSDRPYHRNGFKQAAPTQEITLGPGQSQLVQQDFTFDAESWASQQDIKIIVWAQDPAGSFPAQVYQAATRLWPLISYPGDGDGDGVPDEGDNCPKRYNPEQADGDGDGVGDLCDNCPGFNPDQVDNDEDTFGNSCDNCPNMHALEQTDSDGDGLGNPCDVCPEVPAPGGVDQFGRPRGCIDLDCDVDGMDFDLLGACLAGPGVTGPPPGCTPEQFARADLDGDGDVDLADAPGFQGNFTGPLVSPANYVGVQTCLSCHVTQHASWSGTIHATAFQTLIDGGHGNDPLCFPCHAVGYGAASGFIDLQTTPHLANVQCENCHGPGSNHVSDPSGVAMEVDYGAGRCGMCHQSCHGLCGENHHPQHEEWMESKHSQALWDLYGSPDAQAECLQCHSTDYRLAPEGQKPGLWEAWYNIECVACHGPHGTPHLGQLRLPPWQLCADCHTMSGAMPGQTPQRPQAETLHGTGAYRVDGSPLNGPYTMHWWGIWDECVTCHVHFEPYGGPQQPVTSGHTFQASMRACQPCHSQASATLLVIITREEMEARLGEIARRFDPGDPLYVDPDTLPPEQLGRYLIAKFNYEMVVADRSYGSHNAGYARAALSEAESFFGIPPWLRRGGGIERLLAAPGRGLGVYPAEAGR